jgi:Protein kinase domain/PEGA domain
VIDVIGSGGMGIVYRAHDAALNRTVAIKMLKRADAGPGKVQQLEQFFNRELRATASLQHRNIVTVYESGEQDGNPYLVMECLDGEPVSRVINERRPMPIVDKLELFVQVCDGLQHAHDRKPQVIHRDIKPANVILLRDGTAKIVDFGIARVVGIETSTLQAGQLLGSLSYLSPEQINSVPIDARTDIFSAGVMLYELLTYALPFKGNEPAAVFVKILREDPPPLSTYLGDVPPELQACVSRALAKKTHDRYQTAEELGFDLLQIQKKIKQGMAADFMQRAEASMQRGDLERVKQHLQEILRLDRHHDQANRMLAEVRKAIQEQQRSAQIVQMRSQAQVALAGQQYEEALACADQALQLDPADQASVVLREEIQKAISLGKAVRDSLRRAESALYAGDFDEAREAVDAALRLDTDSAEARALAEIIDKELSERSRRLQVQGLVDNARQGIAQRMFGDAIESLRKAEQLDPGDSNVRELLQWASRGQDQEQRRKDLLDLTDQIHGALRAEDFSSAYTICEVGLGSFPNEPTLQRLKSIAEKQREIAERRRFVQVQSLAAKELLDRSEFSAAIKLLETALQKLPAEPNLEALLALAKTESERQSEDRESQAAQEASERALLQNQAAQRQAATLRTALDQREEVDHLEDLASQLRQMLSGVEFEETTRRSFDPLFEQVRARQLAKEQVAAELQDLRKNVEDSFDPGSRARAKTRLQEVKGEFPHERNVHAACEEVVHALDARGEEHERIIAELSRMAESVKHVPLSESTDLLRNAARISADFSMEPQVGALIQQIEYEVNRRLAQRQALIEEMGQLENASSRARSISGLSQLVSNAHSVASTASGEPDVMAALDRVKAAAEVRRQTISRLLAEVNQVADRALMALGVGQAEQLLAEAQRRASDNPELDDLQETIGRVSAQVHGRRIEHDLVCEELSSLSASISHALTPADLDLIRNRALQIREKPGADQAIVALCEQVDTDVRAARANLLQIELRRLSQDQAVESSPVQLGPTDSASLVKKLQELAKTFPESVEIRGMLLRAEDSLERAQRARNEAAARASAIDLEVKAYTRLLESGQAAKALGALVEAAAKYPESEQLQSLLLKCREQIEAEEEIKRQASAKRAAMQAAIDKGSDLLHNRRYVEATALLEVACQQWPGEKQLEKLLSTAQKSAQKANELSSLSASVSQALTPADLDLIRNHALQIRDEPGADQAIVALCEQVETDVRAARANLLQIELQRLSQDQAVESSTLQLGTTDAASLVKKLQELAKTFPESVEIRGMLLRAEDSLERAQRARNEAAARALAIDLAVKAYTRLLATRPAAKAARAIEEAAAKYPESAQLQSLLLQCREQIEAEEEIKRQASAQRAAMQAAIDKGSDLLRNQRYVEAVAVLEVACQQWPGEKQLEKLLSSAQKSAQKASDRQAAEQEKIEQRMLQVATRPAVAPRRRLLVPAVVACVLLAIAGLLIRFLTRPHVSVLTVQSNPSGAEIEVDGRTCVTPNCSFKLSPGATYSVKAGLKGYVSSSQSVALSNDQTISFELAQEAPPQPVAVPSPAPSQAPVTAKLVLKGVHSGDQLFVDDVRLAASGPPGTWELTPGSHRLRLMAGNQELIADPRSFKANATVVLNRADFKQPAPATSEEQLAWNRINNTADPAAVEEFVRRYPNSSFRAPAESKLEALHWAKASSSGSLRGYQEYAARYTFPPGPHLPAALAEISRLEWEAVQNTTDPLQVKRFLEQNPSGQYHERGVALLDDLAWREAVRKGDASNLKGYLGSYPSGRHREEATAELARLTPPPVAAPAAQASQAPVPIPPAPPVTPKVADNAEDINAIRSVLEGYKSAYDTKDVARLQELWPDMSPKQVNGLRTAFRDAGKVTLTYAITKGPEVSGNVAVVSFQQQIITNATAKAQVTMTLKKDGTSWHITSIR